MHIPDNYLRGLNTSEKEYDAKYLSKIPEYNATPKTSRRTNQALQD